MTHFTIANETNNIAVHSSAKEADAVPDSERFSNEAALAKLAANWPTARLVETWNSLPGVTPVTKFKDRKAAVGRIWKALQSLDGAAKEVIDAEFVPVIEAREAEPPAAVEIATEATEPEPAEPEAATQGGEPATWESPDTNVDAPVAPQTFDVALQEAPASKKASRAKKGAKPATEPGAPREGSKTCQVIAMLKREGGTTLEEIMTAMCWQKHTTRAMLSASSLLKN